MIFTYITESASADVFVLCDCDEADTCLCVRRYNSVPLPQCPLGALRRAAGLETALWRLRLRQIVKGISHLFYQFTDLS